MQVQPFECRMQLFVFLRLMLTLVLGKNFVMTTETAILLKMGNQSGIWQKEMLLY